MFWSDFGDMGLHLIGGGSLSQAVGHLSGANRFGFEKTGEFWVHFPLTRFQASASRQKSVERRGVSTSAWDVSAGTRTCPPIRRTRQGPSMRISLWERGCRKLPFQDT